MSALENYTHAQQERLAFIDFSLQYFGQVARADLIQRFKTGLAASTRDFAAYKTLAPDNLTLKHQTKNYHRTERFEPVFVHNPEAILNGLCRGFGNGLSNGVEPSDVCIDAITLIHPASDIIAALMRAITQRKAIECEYVSLTSGPTRREIVPHAIANNGHRWHVRAFDRKNQEFRDFVCTRLQHVQTLNSQTPTVQHQSFDRQWNKLVTITLKPHPNLAYKQAIEMDYNMVNGHLQLEVRAALVGYLLRQWNVDCSADPQASKDDSFQLALSSRETLTGVDNLTLAPGYK